MSSSESTEQPGWLRLGDLAIGDGGVCVTSLIKDKIREYMLNEEQQQTPAASKSVAPDGGGGGGGGTCVRRIGNSLDLLLRESRNAGRAVAAATAKNKSSSPPSAAPAAAAAAADRMAVASEATAAVAAAAAAAATDSADDHGVSTTISAPADSCSARLSIDGPLPPPPPTFTKRGTTTTFKTPAQYQKEYRQRLKMKRLNDPSFKKKFRGKGKEKEKSPKTHVQRQTEYWQRKKNTNKLQEKSVHMKEYRQKLLRSQFDDLLQNENVYLLSEDEMQISRMPIPADDCANSEMSVDANPSDPNSDLETTTKVNGDGHQKLNGTVIDNSKETDEASETIVIKKETEEENTKEGGGAEEVKSENKTETLSKSTDELVKNGASELSQEPESENNVKEPIKSERTSIDDNDNNNDKLKNKDEEVKPMEIDETKTQSFESFEDAIIKEEIEEIEETEGTVTQEVEKLSNGDVNLGDEVMKNGEQDADPVNGDVKRSDTEKPNNEKVIQKVPEEEDVSSEISADTLSPKQNDEPITARKRSAASHDELSVVSGASSDNDLPKTKKLRSDEDTPLLKDDTRERLIKNIVQSSCKNELELTRSIEKLQNEIKVITEIAQTKRDELVTLIRLQKLKEEILERLTIKVKESDAMKTDNSKDWNLPEMFQINLSQPEHILSEKNITEVLDNREIQHEKPIITTYEQSCYASTSTTSITPVISTPNDWILSDRVNRPNRVQRPILPKPSTANNHNKDGRQGSILDVKLIIADHRSKNPETVVPKRGRRKIVPNDFSVPTSSAPLRYPSPMGFGNSIHHTNDGNFKTTITNTHGVPNNVMEHGSEHNRFKDVPAFPEVTLHPVSQPMQPQQQQQQQQHQPPTSLLHGILTKGAGTHHLPLSMANPPTNYSPTLARLLTAPERCKQTRGKQRQTPAATVVSSNTQSRNEITITPVQSTSMSSTFHQKPSVTSNIPPAQIDDEDASDRLVIDEGQDVMNANSPSSAPQCQGCMQKPAQFVCAGCGNQWYCSKDCQIDAWDDHSEVCSG